MCCYFPGDFHADYTGYTSSQGPGAGLPQTHQLGGSGGGHGGRGGRSKWAYYSAYSYDSLYFPNQMGSGGGTGKDGPGGRGGGGYTQRILLIPEIYIQNAKLNQTKFILLIPGIYMGSQRLHTFVTHTLY